MAATKHSISVRKTGFVKQMLAHSFTSAQNAGQMGKNRKGTEITLAEEIIYSQIYLIRKHKVMLSLDLASLYEVEPKVLNQAVKRNAERFPNDFMFRLTTKEWRSLRSQFVTLDGRGKYPKYLPYVFTEQWVSMLSSVLNSPRAIAVNIQIMRLFVKMRQMITGYGDLLKKIEKLEKAQMDGNQDIASIYKIIKELLEPHHQESSTRRLQSTSSIKLDSLTT